MDLLAKPKENKMLGSKVIRETESYNGNEDRIHMTQLEKEKYEKKLADNQKEYDTGKKVKQELKTASMAHESMFDILTGYDGYYDYGEYGEDYGDYYDFEQMAYLEGYVAGLRAGRGLKKHRYHSRLLSKEKKY